MSLKDALKQGPPPTHPGKVCAVGETLLELPKAEAEALRAMLADQEWTNPAIRRALAGVGVDMNHAKIGHHRRGDCSCRRMGLA